MLAPAWVARYNTWLLIEMTPKGIVFSFLFYLHPDSYTFKIRYAKCPLLWLTEHVMMSHADKLLYCQLYGQEAVCAGNRPTRLAAPQCIVATVTGCLFGACCIARRLSCVWKARCKAVHSSNHFELHGVFLMYDIVSYETLGAKRP